MFQKRKQIPKFFGVTSIRDASQKSNSASKLTILVVDLAHLQKNINLEGLLDTEGLR